MSDTCKSCNAPVEWAITEKLRNIPLDVGVHDDGNLILGADGIARHLPADELLLDHELTQTPTAPFQRRRSHFASPDAQKHRRRGSKAKPLRDRYTP